MPESTGTQQRPTSRAAGPRPPVGDVDGIPLYVYGHAPQALRSRPELARERRKPFDETQPDGYVKTPVHHQLTPLFDIANTVAMKPLSERQQAAVTARRTCVRCSAVSTDPQPCEGPRCLPCDQLHREEERERRQRTCQGCGQVAADPWPRLNRCEPCADQRTVEAAAEEAARAERFRLREHRRRAPIEEWAREVIADEGSCVLDLETTGLGLDSPAYAVEVAVLAMDGTVLMNTLINPRHPVEEGAAATHGLTEEQLRDAPTWDQVLPQLVTVLSGRRICIYNAEFDTRIMRYEMHRFHRAQDQDPQSTPRGQWHRLARQWVDSLTTECAMEQYAEWYGELHSSGEYRFQPLQGGHRAAGDCQALIRRIEYLAAQPA